MDPKDYSSYQGRKGICLIYPAPLSVYQAILKITKLWILFDSSGSSYREQPYLKIIYCSLNFFLIVESFASYKLAPSLFDLFSTIKTQLILQAFQISRIKVTLRNRHLHLLRECSCEIGNLAALYSKKTLKFKEFDGSNFVIIELNFMNLWNLKYLKPPYSLH